MLLCSAFEAFAVFANLVPELIDVCESISAKTSNEIIYTVVESIIVQRGL
jgi:hypothetical protein